jgi:hypothetical protein
LQKEVVQNKKCLLRTKSNEQAKTKKLSINETVIKLKKTGSKLA